jgi:predicted ferric reductase
MKARDLWVAAFLIALFGPVALRLVTIERQGLGQELVTTSGLIATGLLVSTVILPARLKSVTRAFGIEAVLANHRAMGSASALAIMAHLVFVVLNDPRYVALALPFLRFVQPDYTIAPPPLLNPLITPPVRAMAGMAALIAAVVLVAWAARRGGPYERWRNWHMALTVVILAGTALHILLIGHLVPTNALWHWLLGDPIGAEMTRAALAWDALAPVYLALLTLALTLVGINRWLLRPLRSAARYRVARVQHIDATVSTIVLRREGGDHTEPLQFSPGQFAWLRLQQGPLSEEHPFTISSAAQDGHDLEFTIRRSGDWTSNIDKLGTGDFVWVDGPHGAFTPRDDTTGIVLIAAGVGITPAMSMLRTAYGAQDNRPMRVILLDRPGHGLFRQELHQLRDELALELHELGRVRLTAEVLEPLLPPGLLRGQHDYYICGPPLLVEHATEALVELDVPDDRVHTERF